MPHSLSPVLTPRGDLRLEAFDDDAPLSPEVAERIQAPFARDGGHGLLQLGVGEAGSPLPAALAFWRKFATTYIAALCAHGQTAAGAAPKIDAPTAAELAALVDEAPPMRGGEYLRAEVLVTFWRGMQRALEEELATSGLSLPDYLKSRDSRWRLIGRVHLNLAENRRDAEFPFAFMATYASTLGAQGTPRHLPLAQALREYAGAGEKERLLRLLEPVSRAGESCGWLKEIVDSGEIFHPLRWSPADATRFLHDSGTLESAGLVVRMPASWRMNRPSRPSVEATVGSNAPSFVGADKLLDFSVAVSLDGESLTPEEVAALLASTDGLAMLRGKWVEVDRERLQSTLDRFAAVEKLAMRQGVSFAQAMRLLAGAEIGAGAATAVAPSWGNVKAGTWLSDVLGGARHPETLGAAGLGDALKASLRPYQDVGVRWLRFLGELGLGACLADDMGLGKTLQVLALLLSLHRRDGEARPSLIVAPASLLANWVAEAERFAPSLRVRVAHPSFAPIEALKALTQETLAASDVVVTSYGSLTRLENLAAVEWRLVALDEAQVIKNPNAKQTRAVKALRAQSRVALTGTPIENNLRDLWSIFDFLNPGLLGSSKAFADFVRKLAATEPVSYAPLRKLAAPYILRRLKTDRSVISDLPDKTEVKAWCGLSKKQAVLYQTSVDELEKRLKDSEDDIARRGLVLSMLMRLKQICNHPSQWMGEGGYEEADSGKFLRLAEIAETIAARQEKLLVFTQFKEIIAPLERRLEAAFGRPGLVLHGETPVAKRRDLVKTFQEDERAPFFVLSLKAGGSGLNLTAASHVVHFDRWWNPAVENQATDRAFRIGQKRNVLVHKFICRGTIEERIDSLIESKRQLAQDFLSGGGEINLTAMKNDELVALVRLDLEAAMKEG